MDQNGSSHGNQQPGANTQVEAARQRASSSTATLSPSLHAPFHGGTGQLPDGYHVHGHERYPQGRAQLGHGIDRELGQGYPLAFSRPTNPASMSDSGYDNLMPPPPPMDYVRPIVHPEWNQGAGHAFYRQADDRDFSRSREAAYSSFTAPGWMGSTDPTGPYDPRPNNVVNPPRSYNHGPTNPPGSYLYGSSNPPGPYHAGSSAVPGSYHHGLSAASGSYHVPVRALSHERHS